MTSLYHDKSLAADIKRLRAKGLTMEQVGQYLGKHPATLYRHLRADSGLHPRKPISRQRNYETRFSYTGYRDVVVGKRDST